MENSLDTYTDFIAQWTDALSGGYRTPVNFVKGLDFKEFKGIFNEDSYDFILPINPNFDKRKELMRKQGLESKKRKEQRIESRWNNDGGECFLCDNIGQAIAAQSSDIIPNNMMYDQGDFLVLPNRYPASLGHSLFVSKKHDDHTKRVISVNGKYNCINEKTRGAIINPEYLGAMIEFCNSFELNGLANHVLDGMSCPTHQSTHLLPKDSKSFHLLETMLHNSKETHFGENIRSQGRTPFDHLAIYIRENQSINDIEKIACILKKMEEDNQVFTFFYSPRGAGGAFIISPRKNSKDIITNLKIGGGLPIHNLDENTSEYISKIKEHVPMRGEYNWKKYM